MFSLLAEFKALYKQEVKVKGLKLLAGVLKSYLNRQERPLAKVEKLTGPRHLGNLFNH